MLRLATFAALSPLVLASLPQEPSSKASQEAAISEPWICRQQRADGAWSAIDVPDQVEAFRPGVATDDVLVTSLLTLSMLGNGQTPDVGPQRKGVEAALDWLVERQADDGRLAASASKTPVADQAIATLALSEAAYLTGGSRYRVAARAAVGNLERTTLAEGGWSASGVSGDEVDFRATAWATMALASARDAELGERPGLIAAAAWRLRAEGAERAALPPRERSFELSTRLFAGEVVDGSGEFRALAEQLLAQPVEWKRDGEGFDPESFYLRSILAYQCGGKLWKDWQPRMKQLQQQMGLEELRRLAVDPGVPGGSLAAYAYTALTLEVYFRYARVLGAR